MTQTIATVMALAGLVTVALMYTAAGLNLHKRTEARRRFAIVAAFCSAVWTLMLAAFIIY